jgi:hypothetical protein
MKTFTCLFICLLILFYACKKDNDSNNKEPSVPASASYDFNNDGLDDLLVKYQKYTWDGVNISGDLITGMIEPINSSSLLVKRGESKLFLSLNDTIFQDVSDPLYWEQNIQPVLVSISNSSTTNHVWPGEWSIIDNKNQESYYVAISIPSNLVHLIGWLKLKISKSTGKLQIVDKNIVGESYVIVDR